MNVKEKKKLINTRLGLTIVAKLDAICLKVKQKRPRVLSVLISRQYAKMFKADSE